MRPPRILAFGLGLGTGKARRTGFGERVIGSLVKGQFAILKMQDRSNGAVQQAAVMADDDYGVGIFCQIAFQPNRPFKVQIVGRFIQQQQIRLCKQYCGQGHAHPPST